MWRWVKEARQKGPYCMAAFLWTLQNMQIHRKLGVGRLRESGEWPGDENVLTLMVVMAAELWKYYKPPKCTFGQMYIPIPPALGKHKSLSVSIDLPVLHFISFGCWIIFHHLDRPFCVSIHQWDSWVMFIFGLLHIILLGTLLYKFFCGHVFISLGIYLGAELLGHTIAVFNHLRNCQTVSILHSHQQLMRAPISVPY